MTRDHHGDKGRNRCQGHHIDVGRVQLDLEFAIFLVRPDYPQTRQASHRCSSQQRKQNIVVCHEGDLLTVREWHHHRRKFLAALPPQALERWLPHLRPMDLPLGHLMINAHQQPQHVYFPSTPIVLLVHLLTIGSTVEVALAGREGFVGAGIAT
jgi:hypothetical protein